MPNAAPEWQARNLGWRSRLLLVACPLKGLVRRYRISTGSVCGPTPHPQSSSHLPFASHTRAQLQPQGRDHRQDGIKARTALSRQGLVEALPRKTLISGQLCHPLRLRDVAQGRCNEVSISIRLLQADIPSDLRRSSATSRVLDMAFIRPKGHLYFDFATNNHNINEGNSIACHFCSSAKPNSDRPCYGI